jgi:hypothetical protein
MCDNTIAVVSGQMSLPSVVVSGQMSLSNVQELSSVNVEELSNVQESSVNVEESLLIDEVEDEWCSSFNVVINRVVVDEDENELTEEERLYNIRLKEDRLRDDLELEERRERDRLRRLRKVESDKWSMEYKKEEKKRLYESIRSNGVSVLKPGKAEKERKRDEKWHYDAFNRAQSNHAFVPQWCVSKTAQEQRYIKCCAELAKEEAKALRLRKTTGETKGQIQERFAIMRENARPVVVVHKSVDYDENHDEIVKSVAGKTN